MQAIIQRVKGALQHPGLVRYRQNTNWLFWGRVINLVISFFVSIYVARYLGPSNYGLLSFAVSFVGLFSFITNFGLDQILLRDLVKFPDKEKELLGTTIILKLVGGVIAIILSIAGAIYLNNDLFTITLITIISWSALFQPAQILISYYQSKVLLKYVVIVTLFIVAILSGSKVLLVYMHKGIYYFSAIYVIEAILYAALLFYFFKKHYYSPLLWRWNFKLAKQLLHDAWPLALTGAFAVIYSRVDQVIIKYLMDQTSVGIYDAGVRIAEAWYFIPGIVVTSFFPAIISAQKKDIVSYRRRLLYLIISLTGLSVFISVVLFLLSSFIINLLYGHAYNGADIVLRIYVWAGVAITLWTGLTQYLVAENEKYIIFIASFLSMSANVILNFILIPKLGISGAAYATLISYFLLPISILLFKRTRVDVVEILKSF